MTPSNRYISKFRAKSEYELQFILDNSEHYQSDAVEAAKYLLQTKAGFQAPSQEDVVPAPKKRVRPKVNLNKPSYARNSDYLSAYSFSDFLSILAVSFLYGATYALFDYYSGEEWVKENRTLLFFGIAFFYYFLNHVVYKREHGYSNEYLGRVLHSIQFLSCFFIIRILHELLLTLELEITLEEAPGFYVGAVLMFALFLFILELMLQLMMATSKKLFNWTPI